MRVFIFICGFAAACAVSFVAGLLAYRRQLGVDYLRRCRRAVLWVGSLTVAASFLIGLARVIFGAGRAGTEDVLAIPLAPAFFAAVTYAQLLTINRRIKSLGLTS